MDSCKNILKMCILDREVLGLPFDRSPTKQSFTVYGTNIQVAQRDFHYIGRTARLPGGRIRGAWKSTHANADGQLRQVLAFLLKHLKSRLTQ